MKLAPGISTSKKQKNSCPGTPITETLTNGFFTVDKKWTVKYWNKAAEKILGVQAADIVGKNLWERFAGIIPLEFYAIDQRAFIQNTPTHFEEYWGEMGAWFDVITYHTEGTLSVSFKSSNHPHAEYPESPIQRLNTLTELYRFVTEITNDCLWEWNLQTEEIFWIDGGHKRVLGYPIENALIPQSFWESLIHQDDRERVLTGLKKIMKEGTATIWEEKYRFRRSDGIYACVHDRGHIIYDADNNAIRMIGATQDNTEKVLLENKLKEERLIKQTEITDAVMMAQEHERAAIGKDLFDNLNQLLAVTKIYIEMAKKYESKRDIYLDKSTAFILEVMEDINRISKNLAIPGSVIGLMESIQNLLDDTMRIHPLKIELKQKGIVENKIDEKLQLNIFRIVQEQLNNIIGHANATTALISLTRNADLLTLLISDNGNGCDIVKKTKGLGIININSRASLYNGTVKILSKPGAGYDLRVVLQVPAGG